MAQYVGLDVGTQGTKALVYDAERRAVVGRGAVSYGLLEVGREGAAEQDPATWIGAVDDALAQAMAADGVQARAIRGIGVSGQQHGFVALDEDYQVLRPAKLWCDTETAPEAEELSRTLGRPIPAGFTASKTLWLKRHEPEVFARLRHVALPHDHVNQYLTGRLVMECGDASGTGLFDPAGRTFDRAGMDAIDEELHGMFPQLVGPDQPVGTVRPEVARRFEWSGDVFVAPGSGDNMMSALGSGAVQEGTLVVSLGTSGTLFGRRESPVIDPDGDVAPFCDAMGGWLPLICIMNCTSVTEEVRHGSGMSLDELTARAAAESTGCDGVRFLPYLVGERTPNWPHARGALVGLGPGFLRPGLVFRAALEGTTFALYQGAERLHELGVSSRELHVVGGGSHNDLWCQILADVFQVPVHRLAEPETAALGGALQAAAIDSGQPPLQWLREHPPERVQSFEPDAGRAEVYRAAFRSYVEVGRRLFT